MDALYQQMIACAMMDSTVPHKNVTQQMAVLCQQQMIACVMMAMTAPLIPVIPNRDVFTLRIIVFVMTLSIVLTIFVNQKVMLMMQDVHSHLFRVVVMITL